jgi:hypothetical protein
VTEEIGVLRGAEPVLEDLAHLPRADDAVLQGVAVLRVAGVGDAEALHQQRVAQIVDLGERDGGRGIDVAVRVDDEAPIPGRRAIERVVRPAADGAEALLHPGKRSGERRGDDVDGTGARADRAVGAGADRGQ